LEDWHLNQPVTLDRLVNSCRASITH
jgi:hypothetical protein